MKNKMLNVSLIAIQAFIMNTTYLNAGIISNEESTLSVNFKNITNKQLTQLLVKEIKNNIKLPIKIDEMTNLLNVVSYGNIIIYIKELDENNETLKIILKDKTKKDYFIKKLFEAEKMSFCTQKDWKYMINEKGIYPRITYQQKNKKLIAEYIIEKKDCKSLK